MERWVREHRASRFLWCQQAQSVGTVRGAVEQRGHSVTRFHEVGYERLRNKKLRCLRMRERSFGLEQWVSKIQLRPAFLSIDLFFLATAFMSASILAGFDLLTTRVMTLPL